MSTEPETNPATSGGQASCYRHPNRPTGLTCSECGKPICGACAVPGTVGQFCPECAKARGRQKQIRVRQAATGPLYRAAPVTFFVIAATVAIFVLTRISPALENELLFRFAQVNGLIAHGEWYRIFTPVLVHANTVHILFNMYALYQLGPPIERRVGLASYIGLYLASAGWGGAFAFMLGNSQALLVGASGAIFGLFGLWLHSAFRMRDTVFGRNLLSSLGVTLVINAALAFVLPQISWQGHLGGLTAGIILGEAWSRIQDPRLRALAPVAMGILAVLAVAI